MIRSHQVLRVEQSEVLAAHREARALAVATQFGGARPAGGVAYGRVTEVVLSDATYGPHLQVVRQVCTGEPPVFSDSDADAVRCYPPPSGSVADYSVDQYVRMVAIPGSMVAEPLS